MLILDVVSDLKIVYMKRILVTGSAGFMGSHLVNYLIKNKKGIIFGVDDLSGGFERNINPKSKFTKLDLRNRKLTENYIKKAKPQIIYHLAADATEGRSQFTPINCTQRNYLSYLNTLVPAIENGLETVVLTSSMAVYGKQKPPFNELMPCKPEDIYGISKTAMEEATKVLAEVYGFNYVIVRPHNVYGPKQNIADPYRNVIGIFINCLLNSKSFYIYGDGKQKRAFSYIDDITSYLAKCAFLKKCYGGIINLGPMKACTINQLARAILREFFGGLNKVPTSLKPIYLPSRPKEVKYAWSSNKKIRKLLGYKEKVRLEKGIRRTIKWARKIGPQKFRYLEDLELESKKIPLTWRSRLL